MKNKSMLRLSINLQSIYVFLLLMILCSIAHLLNDAYEIHCNDIVPYLTQIIRDIFPDRMFRILSFSIIIASIHSLLGCLVMNNKEDSVLTIFFINLSWGISILFTLISIFFLLLPFIPHIFRLAPKMSDATVQIDYLILGIAILIILFIIYFQKKHGAKTGAELRQRR